jgi:hypothetical protein
MSASVYQGESRALLRWAVVVLLLKTTVHMTAMVLFESPSPRTRLDAPFLLRFPFEFKPLSAALGLFAVFAVVQFGRRRDPLKWGTAALLVLVWLSEIQAAYTGFNERMFIYSGAVFAGWLFGSFFSRALDRHLGRANDPARDDAMGEAGAAGTLVAIYVGASASKLIESGADWADGGHFLGQILTRHTFSGSPFDLVEVMLVQPWIGSLFAHLTLVFQCGMLLYLVSPRLRMLIATMMIGFHLGTYWMMGVKYFDSALYLLVFSYPWPRILRRLRGGPAAPPLPEAAPTKAEVDALIPTAQQAARWLGAVGAATLLLWFGIHHDDSKTLLVETGRGPEQVQRKAAGAPSPGARGADAPREAGR